MLKVRSGGPGYLGAPQKTRPRREKGWEMMFQQLRYLIAVAECGSINQAAERLFISQQSLRASINSLEQKLGFALFHRSAKGMRLTEAGTAVLEDSRKILAFAEGWERFVSPPLRESAEVQIVASPLVYNLILTDLVVECRAKYPHLTLRIYNARDDELLQKLSDHTIGVLGSAPLEEVRQKLHSFAIQHHLAIDAFGADQFCIYLNRSNPLAQQPYLTTEQLNKLVLIAYPQEEKRFYYRAIYRYFSSAPPYWIEKLENIFQMIAELPDAAGVFPRLARVNNVHIQRGEIVALPVEDFPMPAISCMLMPVSSALTQAEKVVAAMIRQRIQSVSET